MTLPGWRPWHSWGTPRSVPSLPWCRRSPCLQSPSSASCRCDVEDGLVSLITKQNRDYHEQIYDVHLVFELRSTCIDKVAAQKANCQQTHNQRTNDKLFAHQVGGSRGRGKGECAPPPRQIGFEHRGRSYTRTITLYPYPIMIILIKLEEGKRHVLRLFQGRWGIPAFHHQLFWGRNCPKSNQSIYSSYITPGSGMNKIHWRVGGPLNRVNKIWAPFHKGLRLIVRLISIVAQWQNLRLIATLCEMGPWCLLGQSILSV